ncbi:membrane protein, partial [Pluralibacter gergoviae]
MKRMITALLAALLLSSNATAAIKISASQAKNMDDVMSLGVIYINHNIA